MYGLYVRVSGDLYLYTGARFWILGGRNPNHGRYSINIDGGLAEIFSGNEPGWRGYVILYERQFAIPGPHRIVIRNEEDKGFQLEAIMYEMPI